MAAHAPTGHPTLLPDLPPEIAWRIADALDSLVDVASLGATCTGLWQVCAGVAQHRTSALRAAARESMDAFVDEWQRFATECDDDADMASQYRNQRLFRPDGYDTHDDGTVDHYGPAQDDQTPDADASLSDTKDKGTEGDAGASVDPRLRFCCSYRLFDGKRLSLDKCTGAPDWSLHVKSHECNRFVCDACARALASAFDDPHHVKLPMERVRMSEPHVWAAVWHDMCPDVYVPTPPVQACRVPAGLDAWIDPDAAQCLADDIRRARSLFDKHCGPRQYDGINSGCVDGVFYDIEYWPADGHGGGSPTIDTASDFAGGDNADGAHYVVDDTDDADGAGLGMEEDGDGGDGGGDGGVYEGCDGFSENSDDESDNDDVVAWIASQRQSTCVDGDDYDETASDASRDDASDDCGCNRDVGDRVAEKNVERGSAPPAADVLADAGSADHHDDGSDAAGHLIVFGDESDDAPRQDPFKCMSSYGLFGDEGWPQRYSPENPAPAALVRIYHVPVLLMGNLRAWLPVGVSRETSTRPYEADVSRYVLVCCDPASPLWGAAMAVRVFTDRWPCIMWLPGADDARAAIEAYRRRPHAHSQKTPMGLREGFVHWLCTARRVPSPMEWKERRAAAIAARRPVVPLWTGFPRFRC
ncbi:hypothetical protein pneo_cds_309 [Pandoravirus neocaledonia]|uniref:F-box domain containing protein n=1 Tax=Pandoravirus neocaledonia TaxID=2107708 RepID=A0A2U7UBU9_9VIRU|nr:hypothetical protein pneo_cds_309 [Pandoravirus neocaledonia]AVK75916.1 hypothetical protein pneo_cds_309 [Pandoravirus neocaledonia]